jgi:hypothetical protein
MASLAEVLLTTIEEFNVELCGSLSSIEAEQLFYARRGTHYNQLIINYRKETNFQSGRYNFFHGEIISRNLQHQAYEYKRTGQF